MLRQHAVFVQRPCNPQYSVKTRIAVLSRRPVQTFPRQTNFLGHQRHAFGSCNIAGRAQLRRDVVGYCFVFCRFTEFSFLTGIRV